MLKINLKLLLLCGVLSLLIIACNLSGSDDIDDNNINDPDTNAVNDPDTNVINDPDSNTVNDPDTNAVIDSNSTDELGGACEQSKLYGGFEVAMEEERGYSAVSGDISDGVIPATILELVGEEGGCKLMHKKNPFCDPGCASDEACNHEGQCVRFPVELNLGTVTISGLANPVSMEPAQPGNNYFFTGLDHPGFAPQADITLMSTGGELNPITLKGRGLESIDVITTELEIKEGQDLPLSWTAPTVETEARVYVKINIDQHGNSPVNMTCDFEDTGSGLISGTLITQLINFGVSGFPTIDFYRRTVDKVEVSPAGLEAGCAEFRVFSHIGYTVNVANHTPCKKDSDCSEGERCDQATETCVPII